MKRYTGSTTIKIVLLFFGLILMAGTIFYSNSIVAQLREDNRQIVTVYSRIIANTINEEIKRVQKGISGESDLMMISNKVTQPAIDNTFHN